MFLKTRLLTKIILLDSFNIKHFNKLINMLNNSHVKQHFPNLLSIMCLFLFWNNNN